MALSPTALALACICAVFTAAHAYATVETRQIVLVHDGLERSAIVDAPREATRAPLLIGLHGGIAGAASVRRRAGITLAERGWVVAWPSAIDDWNDGRTDQSGRPHDSADDVGFLRRMIERLAKNGLVDPSRVFVAGPSIGGVMALKLLCDAPELIAGAAIAIASLPEGKSCADGPPRPVLYIHGTKDEVMPPEGGPIGGRSLLVRDRGAVRPVSDTVAELAARNRCSGRSERRLPDLDRNDGSTVLERTYNDCAAPLVHYVVDGGGHSWPGGRESRLGAWIAGRSNQDFSASRTIERFFEDLAAP